MSDLIRREDVARAVRLLSEVFIDGGSPTAAAILNIAMDRISALPAVQPAHVNETPKSEHVSSVMLTPATKGGHP